MIDLITSTTAEYHREITGLPTTGNAPQVVAAERRKREGRTHEEVR